MTTNRKICSQCHALANDALKFRGELWCPKCLNKDDPDVVENRLYEAMSTGSSIDESKCSKPLGWKGLNRKKVNKAMRKLGIPTVSYRDMINSDFETLRSKTNND